MPPHPEPDQKHSVQRQFGAVAANYGRASFVHRQGPDLEALLSSLAGSGAQRALDVGCGAGHTAHALAGLIPEVVALDLTEAMLEQTRQGAAELGLDHIETRRGDAETLPFEDASFDVVACRLCAHHFGDPAKAVREAFRVLAPGGRYLLIDIVAPDVNGLPPDKNTPAKWFGNQKPVPATEIFTPTGRETDWNERNTRKAGNNNGAFAGPHARAPGAIWRNADVFSALDPFDHLTNGLRTAFAGRADDRLDTKVRYGSGDQLTILMIRNQHIDRGILVPAIRRHHDAPVPETQNKGFFLRPESLRNISTNHPPAVGETNHTNKARRQPAGDGAKPVRFENAF